MVAMQFNLFAPKSVYHNQGASQKNRLNKWLNAHPQAYKIYNSFPIAGFTFAKKRTHEELADCLIELGAKVVVVDQIGSLRPSILVITDEMVLATNGEIEEVYAAPNKDAVIKQIKTEAVQNVSAITGTVPAKQKSVVKSAVAGGVIAGGVGAVVGAIAAASHNSNATPTKKTIYISSNSGKTRTYFNFYNVNGPGCYRFQLDSEMLCGERVGGTVYLAQGVKLDDTRIDEAIANYLDTIWK